MCVSTWEEAGTRVEETHLIVCDVPGPHFYYDSRPLPPASAHVALEQSLSPPTYVLFSPLQCTQQSSTGRNRAEEGSGVLSALHTCICEPRKVIILDRLAKQYAPGAPGEPYEMS